MFLLIIDSQDVNIYMDQNYNKLISRRIKTAIDESKITQAELSHMIQKSRAYISNITKGRYVPKISELVKIAKYLKKPVSYFLGEDDAGLMHYVDKSKKWDKFISLVEKDLRKDFRDDVVAIPLLDNSKLRNRTLKELFELKEKANRFVYLSRSYMKNNFQYYKPVEEIVALNIFIRDYPEFGIYLGDITFFEPMLNNNIEEHSGKLFGVLYKGDVGLKRIYRDGKNYYFEPLHSNPYVEKISPDDPNLVIPGRVIFNMHTKIF